MDAIKENRAVCVDLCVRLFCAWAMGGSPRHRGDSLVHHFKKRHNSFWAKFNNSGNSDMQQQTVALGNVHEIAHEENLQEENLEKQLGNALGTRTRICRGGNQ